MCYWCGRDTTWSVLVRGTICRRTIEQARRVLSRVSTEQASKYRRRVGQSERRLRLRGSQSAWRVQTARVTASLHRNCVRICLRRTRVMDLRPWKVIVATRTRARGSIRNDETGKRKRGMWTSQARSEPPPGPLSPTFLASLSHTYATSPHLLIAPQIVDWFDRACIIDCARHCRYPRQIDLDAFNCRIFTSSSSYSRRRSTGRRYTSETQNLF